MSLKDGFSLASPAGRLHARILASVAEYETEVRAERVAAGQAVARRKGKKWGGSKPGWRWKVSDDQVTADPRDESGGEEGRPHRQGHGAVPPDDLPGSAAVRVYGRMITSCRRILR